MHLNSNSINNYNNNGNNSSSKEQPSPTTAAAAQGVINTNGDSNTKRKPSRRANTAKRRATHNAVEKADAQHTVFGGSSSLPPSPLLHLPSVLSTPLLYPQPKQDLASL